MSKDWDIEYPINGRRFKRCIGPNKKVAEQVLMDVEVKKAKGTTVGIYEYKPSHTTWKVMAENTRIGEDEQQGWEQQR